MNKNLQDSFVFRDIRQEEAEQAVIMETVCFPPHEACTREMMLQRIAKAPEVFLVAEDKETGKLAGFLSGLSTDEHAFRDEFFYNAELYNPNGKNIMILGLNVLPEYRGKGLARELVSRYIGKEQKNGRQAFVLTCLSDKVSMYERMGFFDKGISNSAWGGEQWHEMCFCKE